MSDLVPEAEPELPDLIDTPQAGPAALRGSMLRSAGYAAGLLLGLATAPLLTRHLGVVDYGRYITVVSVIGLVAGLTEGGLNAIALREYARLKGQPRWTAMRDMLGMRLLLASTGAVVAVAFCAIAGYDHDMVLGAVGAALGMVCGSLQTFLFVGLQGDLRFGWVTIGELVRQGVAAIGIVLLIVLGAGLVGLLWLAAPATLIALLFAAWLVRGSMPLRPAFHLGRWRPLLRETLPYALAVAISVIYFRAAIIIASLVTTDVEAGYFATSFRIIEMLLSVSTVALGAAYPILARAAETDRERFRYALGRTLQLSLTVGAGLAVLTALIAPLAIRLLAGPDFAPSVDVLRLQAIGLAANFVVVAAGYGLLSLGRTRQIMIANGLGLTLTVVLNLVLASAWDANGAAIATATAEWVLAVALLAFLASGHAGLGGLAGAVPGIALSAAAALAIMAVPGLPSLVETIIGAVVFVVVLKLTGRFPPEVGELLRARRLRSGPR